MNGSNIEMNRNQLILPVIDNESSVPSTGSEVAGQMYYNDSTNIMYFYNGTGWVEMDGTGSGVSSFQATDGTYIDFAPNTATTGAVTLTGDLSASGTADATTFLRGDNTWATPAGSYTSWSLEADSGTAVNITDGLRVDFTGGIGIDTTVASAVPNTLTIDLDVNKLTTATPVVGDFLAFSDESVAGDPTRKATISTILALGTQGTLTGIDAGAGIVINDSGTATPEVAVRYDGNAANVIQSATDAETTAIAASDVIIYSDSNDSDAVKRGLVSDLPYDSYSSWTLSDGSTSQTIASGNTVTVATVADNAAKAGIEPVVSATDTLTLNLDLSNIVGVTTIDGGNDEIVFYDSNNSQNAKITPADIHLNQWGAAEANINLGSNKLVSVADGVASSDGVNLGQVQSLVAGSSLFQGGYNADTNTPALTGGSNIAVAQGDFYAVTTSTGASFLGTTVEVGDLIFANNAIAAGSTPSASDYTVVQSGQSIAGEGATDNATTKGIAGFNSAHFNVSSNGWVSADIYGGTSNVGIVPTGGSSTTFLRGDGAWVTPTNTQNPFQTISGSGSNNTDSGITLSNSGGTVLVLGAGSVTASQSGDTITLTGTDTNTTYQAGTGLTLDTSTSPDTFNANVDGLNSVAPNASSSTASRTYKVQVDSSDNLVVNVPWSDTNTNLVTSVDEDTTAAYKGIRVTPTTGDVKVGLDINGLTALTSPASGDLLAVYDISGTPENKKATVSSLAPQIRKASTYAETITSYGTITHNLGSFDVIVQLYDATSYETIYACVDRASVDTVTISGNNFPSSNIRVLVSLADAGA